MKRNDTREFAGLEQIKQRHAEQLHEFETWGGRGEWLAFHRAHYDWWMFPIDRPSAYGLTWTVYDGDIFDLKQDADFMRRYRRGIELVALAWGWDVAAASVVRNPQPGQSWHDWPVRLFKMALSARLFREDAMFASLKKYAVGLMARGCEMSYSGHDLSWLFTTGIDPER